MSNNYNKIKSAIQTKTLGSVFTSRVKNILGLKINPLVDTIASKERLTLNQLQEIEKILNKNNLSLGQFKSILDFGCGPGRFTKHLFKIIPDTIIYGCDVESDLILKCKKKFSKGSFFVNKSIPPLNFLDRKFDFIFSYSVFTHLSETNHILWLKELAKFLNDDGVMLHTTHGYECLNRLKIFNPESIKKYNFKQSLDDIMNQKNFYHFTIPTEKSGKISSDNLKKPEYGLSIISKDYIVNNWEKYSGMQLYDYIEAGIESNPEGCHDVVILKKTKSI